MQEWSLLLLFFSLLSMSCAVGRSSLLGGAPRGRHRGTVAARAKGGSGGGVNWDRAWREVQRSLPKVESRGTEESAAPPPR